MIQIVMQGRCGNQLFQYAFAYHLKEKYFKNDNIYIKFPKYYDEKKDNFEDSLSYFKITYNIIKHIRLNLIQYIILYMYLFIRKVFVSVFKLDPVGRYNFEKHFLKFLNFFGLYILSHAYYEFKDCHFKNKIIIGSFESDKFFSDVRGDLLKFYIPKIKYKNNEMIKKIKNNNSVCISIRRGDFLSSKYKKQFYVCG